jgi:hypothetical protein
MQAHVAFAPDGRILQVELRQGDQHNVASVMRHWAAAVRMPSGVVPQLVTALESKLSPALLRMPVDVPAKAPLMLRISRGDNLDNVVKIFCDVNQLPMNFANQIIPAVRQRLGI